MTTPRTSFFANCALSGETDRLSSLFYLTKKWKQIGLEASQNCATQVAKKSLTAHFVLHYSTPIIGLGEVVEIAQCSLTVSMSTSSTALIHTAQRNAC